MGNLESRLSRLEDRVSLQEGHNEDEHKERWLARARLRYREALDATRVRSRDLIGLFRTQDILSGMSAEDLVDRILSWRPPIACTEGFTRVAVEREVALAIYQRQLGTEQMACPPTWRESFEAGDELRERFAAIPEEELAAAWLRLDESEDDIGLDEFYDFLEELAGITEDLILRAIGPDADSIPAEEAELRIEEYLFDVLCGEKGWRVHQRMCRLQEGERDGR